MLKPHQTSLCLLWVGLQTVMCARTISVSVHIEFLERESKDGDDVCKLASMFLSF